ncbi:MAG: hypothetical protein HY319_10135 [Armatimonadetes bacterium]|nr:hypothetical protein [Armatimonadota bacterium]
MEQWKAWAGLYYRDNAAVLFHPELAGNLTPMLLAMHRGNYFRIYLLCLYLKLRLLQMMSELVPEREEPVRTAQEVESVWTRYDSIRVEHLRFRNRFWFAELTRDTAGRMLYPRIGQALGLRPLMREVTEELDVLHSQYRRLAEQQQRGQRAQLQQRLNVLTWYLFPLVITTGILGMNVIVPGSEIGLGQGLLWFAGTLALIVAAMFLGLKLTRGER